MIEAVIFDFDGVILDTELLMYKIILRIFRENSIEFPKKQWIETIGETSRKFDPINYLYKNINQSKVCMSKSVLEKRRLETFFRESEKLLLPKGFVDYLIKAKYLNLKLAIASNSKRDWIEHHLNRLKIREYFDLIVTAEDVNNPKPSPDIYNKIIESFEISPSNVISFEDSPHGATAAKLAKTNCVVLKTKFTKYLKYPEVDLYIDSHDKKISSPSEG